MRNRMLRKMTMPLLAVALSSVCPSQASIQMARVATIPGAHDGTLPCGDLFHDGHVELVASGNGMDVIEDTGWNEYRVQHVSFPPVGHAFALGDGNGNGLSELLTAGGAGESLCIWEQVAPDSFPSHLVFWDTTMINTCCYRAEFCDLDKDRHAEILADDRRSNFWENCGGDRYELVPFPTSNWWEVGPVEASIGDFDRDSLMEMGGGGWTDWMHQGGLVFFECCGNDSYVCTCTIPQPPGQSWDPVVWSTAAHNMEGDGLPEFVSVQYGHDEQSGLILLRIVKEPVHNQFVEVCTLNFYLGPWFSPCVASGDVDGDGRDELVISTINDVRLLKCIAPGQYEQEWLLDEPNVVNLRMFDLNQDGRSELVFATDSTYIYEDTNGLGTAIFEKRPPQYGAVTVQPTITGYGAPVLFSGVPPGSDIEVLSLDGRLVSRTQGVRQSAWTWNLRDQHGDLVSAGTYFAVIRSKGKATSLKLCVVK